MSAPGKTYLGFLYESEDEKQRKLAIQIVKKMIDLYCKTWQDFRQIEAEIESLKREYRITDNDLL